MNMPRFLPRDLGDNKVPWEYINRLRKTLGIVNIDEFSTIIDYSNVEYWSIWFVIWHF